MHTFVLALAISTLQAPRHTTRLSLVADRGRKLTEKQIAELQAADYNQTNNATFTEALAEAKKRLVLQKEECDRCNASETKLQAAYNISLEQHKRVEAVEDSVIEQNEALNEYEAADLALIAANSDFDTAKGQLQAGLSAWLGTSECTASPTKPFSLDTYPFTAIRNLTLPDVLTRPPFGQSEMLVDIIDTKAVVVLAKHEANMSMYAAWRKAIAKSIGTGLCGNSNCTEAALESAKEVRDALDGFVVSNETATEKACAAISAIVEV